MRIRFWGTRGSIPVPGRDTIIYGGNTTCLEITLQGGKTVIIDAGTGIRPLGDKLIAENENVEIHLLITHIHWDHNLGFPFFAPIYDPATKIYVDGHQNSMKGLRNTLDSKTVDGLFPITFDDLKANIHHIDQVRKGVLEIDGTRIDSIPIQHPQGGIGFRFREGDKNLVFITDNELREDAWEGRTPEEYAKFCEGADILIHDAQYTPREIKERKGWGHSDYRATFDLAHRANVKKLLLFHHDPTRTDPEVKAIKVLCEDLAGKRNSNIIIDAARENTELEL